MNDAKRQMIKEYFGRGGNRHTDEAFFARRAQNLLISDRRNDPLGRLTRTSQGFLSIEMLDELAAFRSPSSRPGTTEMVKGHLADLAPRFGYFSISGGKGGRKELLFDVIWTECERSDGYFSRLFLACECELDRPTEKLMQDFVKLLFAKAPLKMFVMRLANHRHHRTKHFWEDRKIEIARSLIAYENTEPGEIYLIVDLNDNPYREYVAWMTLWDEEENKFILFDLLLGDFYDPWENPYI